MELFKHYKVKDNALILDRIFYKEKGRIHVSREYLGLPDPGLNQGAPKIIKASLRRYPNMGMKMVHAVRGIGEKFGPIDWSQCVSSSYAL